MHTIFKIAHNSLDFLPLAMTGSHKNSQRRWRVKGASVNAFKDSNASACEKILSRDSTINKCFSFVEHSQIDGKFWSEVSEKVGNEDT